MVRVCAFPGCETKMKRYNPETFHRLPLRYDDRSLVNSWLIVLNMDIETPYETLIRKDYRVCSAHFDEDEFVVPKRAADPNNPKRVSLKKCAVPRVKAMATDRLETAPCEESCPEITFDISEFNFDEENNCSNEDGGEEENICSNEEGEEEEEEKKVDNPDSDWELELSDILESDDSDQMESDDFDSELLRSVRQLCPECGAFFFTSKTHTCEYKIKPVSCNVCGKKCVDKSALKTHSRIHKESYEHPCKFCMVPFKTRLDKQAHERAHTHKAKPYECPDCSMAFSKLPARNLHLKGHRGPKMFPCSYCSLEFRTRHSFDRHMVVHNGVKQFLCKFCFRSFNQPGHLTSHLRLHTGEKPYQCKHCDESFNHNVSLKSHVTRYHKGASDSEPMGDTPERMEPPGTGIGEVNEELVIGDTEDTVGDVIDGDPKLKEVAKQFKKTDYRSMGRPKGRPKIHSSTREKDLISVLPEEAPDPTTAADTSEEVHLRRATSKNIESDGSDRDRTSEFTVEDDMQETKVLRKGKSKASQRPKSLTMQRMFLRVTRTMTLKKRRLK
ncbi:unnamed protein product [Arctogadus glacialis]